MIPQDAGDFVIRSLGLLSTDASRHDIVALDWQIGVHGQTRVVLKRRRPSNLMALQAQDCVQRSKRHPEEEGSWLEL